VTAVDSTRSGAALKKRADKNCELFPGVWCDRLGVGSVFSFPRLFIIFFSFGRTSPFSFWLVAFHLSITHVLFVSQLNGLRRREQEMRNELNALSLRFESSGIVLVYFPLSIRV